MKPILTFRRDGEESLTYVGSLGGHAYYVSESELTWQEAIDLCEAHGGHLACIGSQEENDLVADCAEVHSTSAWIGFTDHETEGEWHWLTGEPVVYTNWRPGQPGSDGGDEDGASINPTHNAEYPGHWHDQPLASSRPCVMEAPENAVTVSGVANCAEIPDLVGSWVPIGSLAPGMPIELVASDFAGSPGSLNRMALVMTDQISSEYNDYWLFSLNGLGDQVVVTAGAAWIGFLDTGMSDNTGGSVVRYYGLSTGVAGAGAWSVSSWTDIKKLFR